MIRFNANLFRIAFLCASNEETHYYLRGVFIEPHAIKGVTMTATNVHQMISIHDENGRADESAIINLGNTLKQCKGKRGTVRIVSIGTGENEAVILEAHELAEDTDFRRVAIATNVRVDGSFPDYRRVIPRTFNNSMTPAFASQYISALALVGVELVEHFFGAKPRFGEIVRKDVLQICAGADSDNPEGSPALFAWPLVPQAVAILMPARHKGNSASLPSWYSATAPIAQAAE